MNTTRLRTVGASTAIASESIVAASDCESFQCSGKIAFFMAIRNPQSAIRNRGSAYVLALVLLSLFTTLAVAYSQVTDMSLRKSDNSRISMEARLSAESGMSYMLDVLQSVRLPGDTTEASFATNCRAALCQRLDGSGNLGAGVVAIDGSAVIVPSISLAGRTFQSRLTWSGANTARLVVTGFAQGVHRTISMDFGLVPKRPVVFDYGLASKGPISVDGNARIVGVNEPGEASVLSATSSVAAAITVGGSTTVQGDLSTSGSGTHVTITGSPTIAGSKDPAVIAQHVHLGVEAPDWPALDTTPLIALSTTIIDSTTDINGSNLVFNNARIKAGTNPRFTRDMVINGVLVVEAPNQVRFEGKTTINGLVVTVDPATGQPIGNCQLFFAGNVEARGVEALPATAEFAAVKQKTGTFIVAPGFGVTFAGNFSAVNGTIAADQLTFTGTAEGVVKGSVLGLKDLPTSLSGNVDISVDRKNADPNAAGFVKSFAFAPLPGTYSEGGP